MPEELDRLHRERKEYKDYCSRKSRVTENFKNLDRETELIIAAHLGEKKLFQLVEKGMQCKVTSFPT